MIEARLHIACNIILLFTIIRGGVTQNRVGDSCIDSYTNTVGVCRDVRNCQSARDDHRFNGINPTFCSFNYESPLVCCKDASTILQTPSPSNDRGPVWSGGEYSGSKRLAERKCEEYSKSVTETVDFISLMLEAESMSISAAKCNYTKVELIVGGEDTDVGEFPHMAAIGWPAISGGYRFLCGGALISEKFVITAGHCLNEPRNTELASPEPTVVRLGDQNINPKVNDGANPIEVAIKSIHKHPSYNPPKRYDDLGLLELAADVRFETNIRPACLWTKAGFAGQTKAVATGWGVTNTKTRQTSDELQKVSLTLYENNYCNSLIPVNRHWKGFADTQMCAGELAGGKDTCQGDSGGPLQFASKENHCVFYVVGVTSFGYKCAYAGTPAVYTRVSAYLDWIESIVWPNER